MTWHPLGRRHSWRIQSSACVLALVSHAAVQGFFAGSWCGARSKGWGKGAGGGVLTGLSSLYGKRNQFCERHHACHHACKLQADYPILLSRKLLHVTRWEHGLLSLPNSCSLDTQGTMKPSNDLIIVLFVLISNQAVPNKEVQNEACVCWRKLTGVESSLGLLDRV